MAFTNALAIVDHIKTLLTAPLTTLVPGISLNLDEPINLVYQDLPMVSTYPIKEDFVYEESFASEDKKHLQVRIEIRMKSGPATTVATPVINAICNILKANPRLDGLATYLEIQSIQWGNDNTSSGIVCGAAIDVQVQYLAS